jgi:hypothetical protein
MKEVREEMHSYLEDALSRQREEQVPGTCDGS